MTHEIDRVAETEAEGFQKSGEDGVLRMAWDRFWMSDADVLGCDCASTRFLLPCLRARNATTVLCVGNGASREAPVLVHAGFVVDVLDISVEANRMLADAERFPWEIDRRLCGQFARPGGRMSIHAGDFRRASSCPGPFDVVIVRRVLQYYPAEAMPLALEALRARLAPRGFLVLESQNARATRKLYTGLLRRQGFAVCWDLELRGRDVAAPRMVSRVGARPVAWVMSSTG